MLMARSLYDTANIFQQSQARLQTSAEYLPHVYPSGKYLRPQQPSQEHPTDEVVSNAEVREGEQSLVLPVVEHT